MESDLALMKKQADKLISDINKKHIKIGEIKDNCDVLLNEIRLSSNNNKKITGSLSTIKKTSELIFSDINKKKLEINNEFSTINNYYEKKYLPLVKKIDCPESGFSVKIKQANVNFKEIEKLSADISKHYVEIKKNINEYIKIVNNLKSIERSAQKIFHFISDKKPKIEDILKSVSETERKVNLIYAEMKKLLSLSVSDNKVISSLKIESDKDYSQISTNKEASDKLLKSIQDIYEIAAETGLSGEFENRRNNLKKDIDKWEYRLLIVSLTLLISLCSLFFFQLYLYKWDIAGHNFDLNFYVRFLILSPVVYYLFFCSVQHDKAKKLHDKYSFKTTLAMTIKSHIELLLSNESFQTQDRIDKILEFIITGFNKIYNEPYCDDDFKVKLKLANIELDIENKILEKLTKAINK